MMAVFRFWLILFSIFFFPPANADDALLQSLIPESTSQRPLTAEQAFQPSITQDQHQILIRFNLKPGYYLYRDKIHITRNDQKSIHYTLPAGQPHEDEFMGKTDIYPTPTVITASVDEATENTVVSVSYQGCIEGLCYPPTTSTLTLESVSPENQAIAFPQNTMPVTSQSGITFWQWTGFWILGLGLAFTPCVYPMYPVLSAMLSHQGHTLNWRKGLVLSAFYVLGLALVYTLLGLLVSIAGAQIQGYIQKPWVLSLFSLFYILLAAALFYDKQIGLPTAWRDRLQERARQQSLGSYTGVTFLGVLSGLIGSPCTSAPLSGILLLITKTGEPIYGSLALFVLSLGMGTPLLLLGAFSGRWMPKTGKWMVTIKQIFDLLLLAMPLWLMGRFIPSDWIQILWGIYLPILLSPIIWLIIPRHIWFIRIGLLLILMAASQLYISITKHSEKLTPPLTFRSVQNQSELQTAIQTAIYQGQPVMIDVYADWCVACRELDEITFRDKTIQKMLTHYQRIRADVTQNTPEQQNLLKTLNVLGLPYVLFFNPRSDSSQGLRIDGFISPDDLKKRLNQCHQKKVC